MKSVAVIGDFDDPRCRDIRFLHEASRLGPLHVLLHDRASCKFPMHERKYFLESIRFVSCLTVMPERADLRSLVGPDGILAIPEGTPIPVAPIKVHIIPDVQLAGFPDDAAAG